MFHTTGLPFLFKVVGGYLTIRCTRYSASQRAKIGKYAVTTAARLFSRKLQKQISETTVRSIRDAFHEESTKRRYLQ